MIWIASFPRSGNTFMRNLFFDVYGMESCSFPKEGKHREDKDYQVTKTHQLPKYVSKYKKDDFVIYLVRDGRDSVVSNSHYRKNFRDAGSDFNENIKEGIIAPAGTHFGGWSKNISKWSKHANIIIRFEDLILDPIACLQQIAQKIELPEPDFSKIKSFNDLKHGTPQYGSGGKGGDKKEFACKFFHSGKIGRHITEMPNNFKKLFSVFHGDIMAQLGYSINGEIENYTFKEGKTLKRDRALKSLFIIKYIRLIYFSKWIIFSVILKNKLKSIKNKIN